jgi:hypothetical protein
MGAPDTNVFNLARRGLKMELRAAPNKSRGNGQAATQNNDSVGAKTTNFTPSDQKPFRRCDSGLFKEGREPPQQRKTRQPLSYRVFRTTRRARGLGARDNAHMENLLWLCRRRLFFSNVASPSGLCTCGMNAALIGELPQHRASVINAQPFARGGVNSYQCWRRPCTPSSCSAVWCAGYMRLGGASSQYQHRSIAQLGWTYGAKSSKGLISGVRIR